LGGSFDEGSSFDALGSAAASFGGLSKAHPPYHEMVKLAIAELKDRSGSSLAAIVK
jgi:hypothetical protein